MPIRHHLAAAFAAVLAAIPASGGPLQAEQIREETVEALQIGGPDAIGGVGDWYLANDVLEIIVDDPSRRNSKLNHGGTIVDAGLRGRHGDDQFARLFPLVNMDQKIFLGFDAIRAEVDPDGRFARLVVTGEHGLSSEPRGSALARALNPLVPEPDEIRNVFVTTEYAVFPGEPFVHITTTIRNDGDRPAPVFAYGEVWMRGGRSGRSFVGNTLDPDMSRGFHHRSFDPSNILGASDALSSFTFVSVPGMRHYPPIAYAVFSPERTARGEPSFGVTHEHVTFVNAFLFDPGWREIGLLRLLRATRHELLPGETWTYLRRLLVVPRADVAATTDVIFKALGFADGSSGIQGRVAPADEPCVVQVDDAATGAPVTEVETPVAGAEAGLYRAILPPGDYRLTLRAPHRADRHETVSVVAGAYSTVPDQSFPEPAWLVFGRRAFADGGPGRVVVQGVDGTQDPVFDPELVDFRVDGELAPSGTETRDLQFIGNDTDPRRSAIRPGRYRLTATRGFLYDVDTVTVEVAGPGAEVPVRPFEMRRIADLPGYQSADFHVHAEASDDSGMLNVARVRSYVAENVDIMISTDHDHLSNFDPALDALDVRDRIQVIRGVEVTGGAPSHAQPYTIGHHNAWPMAYQPHEHRMGAPPSQELTLADLYALLRDQYGARVVQMNHPRVSDPDGLDPEAYLTHLGTAGVAYDPTLPMEAWPNSILLVPGADGHTRGIDFDAIEVMNGAKVGRYRQVRADWYSFLRQGYRSAGTSNSDTHGPGSTAGYPRNYVDLRASGGRFDEDAFDDAVHGGRLFGTNGPLFTAVDVGGGRIGDLVAATGGRVRVGFEVVAAPWVPVDEVRLVRDGEIAQRFTDVGPRDEHGVLHFAVATELAFERDGFVTIEAGAPLEAELESWDAAHPGPYSETVAPRFVPAAFTNPVFVDAEGDGRWDPPGLPPPPRRFPFAGALVALLALAAAGLLWRRRRGSGRDVGPGV